MSTSSYATVGDQGNKRDRGLSWWCLFCIWFRNQNLRAVIYMESGVRMTRGYWKGRWANYVRWIRWTFRILNKGVIPVMPKQRTGNTVMERISCVSHLLMTDKSSKWVCDFHIQHWENIEVVAESVRYQAGRRAISVA